MMQDTLAPAFLTVAHPTAPQVFETPAQILVTAYAEQQLQLMYIHLLDTWPATRWLYI